MNSRQEILRSIRRHLIPSIELPDVQGDWIQYDDPVAQFKTTLEAIGGTCHEVQSAKEIEQVLHELATAPHKVVSYYPGVFKHQSSTVKTDRPHDLEDVHLAVLQGQLGVAENAAVWIDDQHLPQRVVAFLSQHLALIVPRQQVVHNMYEAYERIRVGTSPLGCFIAGPSKTADIEQSLVKGAHGARTMNVFLIDEEDASKS